MSRNFKIIITLKLILWVIIIYSGINIFIWLKDNYKNDQLINNINDLIIINESDDESIIDVNTKKIVEINEDIKGWIKVLGTNVNYPFVQTNNNEYYLYHSLDKSNNNAGWIFLDFRNNIDNLNKNTIFYGHNRINNTMFGSLKKIMNDEWLNNNNLHYINISTNKYNSLWEIFSIYHTDKTNDYLDIDFNDEELNEYIELVTNRSIYNFDNKPNKKDYLITLSTCYNDNERFVVHGKLIKKEGKLNEE